MADVTIPSLLEMSVKCIAENLHLFSCLQGLPSFIVEMILSLFQQVLGSHNSLVDDDNIRQFLELRMQEQEEINEIKVLNLSWSFKLSDVGIGIVTGMCQMIQDLDLSFCENVTNHGLRELGRKCFELRRVNLTGCEKITDNGLKALVSHCHSLVSLSVDLCKVTDFGIQFVARNAQNLRELSVGSTRITNVGVQIVADHGRNLISLNVGGCQITDFDMEDIARRCISLEHFKLRGCKKITDRGAIQLVRLLSNQARHGKALLTLDLGGCSRISPHILTQIFQQSVHLRSLDLRGTQTNASVLSQIAQSCQYLSSLVLYKCDLLKEEDILSFKSRMGAKLNFVTWDTYQPTPNEIVRRGIIEVGNMRQNRREEQREIDRTGLHQAQDKGILECDRAEIKFDHLDPCKHSTRQLEEIKLTGKPEILEQSLLKHSNQKRQSPHMGLTRNKIVGLQPSYRSDTEFILEENKDIILGLAQDKEQSSILSTKHLKLTQNPSTKSLGRLLSSNSKKNTQLKGKNNSSHTLNAESDKKKRGRCEFIGLGKQVLQKNPNLLKK